MAITFEFQSFTITQDEGDPFWRCSVELANPRDAFSFRPNDQFTLNLMGELYQFLVESVNLSRSGPVEFSATVEGVGLGALLSPPRDSAITKTWDVNTTASEIVTELLETIDSWSLVNWTIPANRLSVENGSKVDTAKLVVEAVGGVLESLPDGSFIVRKKFPVSPLKYAQTTPDLELDEVVDIESVSFSCQNSRYVDWVRIRDVDEQGVSDRVEIVFDEGTELSGTLRVYPMPWRKVHLEHTGPSDLQLELIGEVIRLVPAVTDDPNEERIEIYEGQGSVQFPIVDLVSLRWQVRDLQGLYFEPYTETVYSSHPTEKNSLVYVTYHTKSLNYHVASPIPQDVQFLVVED